MLKHTLIIATQNQPCRLILLVEGEGELRVSGKCLQTETLYFDRKKRIKGKETMIFNLPLTPKTLVLESNKMIKADKKTALPPSNLKTEPENWAFFKHIFDIAQRLNGLGTGIYTDNQGRFPMVISEIIKNTEGKPLNTPARVSRLTGQIQISKQKFMRYSVPMRIFILLHEWSHYKLQTSNEIECDLQALEWHLGLGFSQVEAIYAQTKVFSGENPLHLERTEVLVDYIKHYNYALGYDNGFLSMK
jgi:hypothetical protein